MDLVIKILIYIVEAMFALGVIGCVFVLILSSIDDAKVLFHREQPHRPSPAEASAAAISQQVMHPQAH
ncbi:MAG TPA: hypothetical protein VGG46_07715 [Terriglobales bacterium]|jgi:hypothetical protein